MHKQRKTTLELAFDSAHIYTPFKNHLTLLTTTQKKKKKKKKKVVSVHIERNLPTLRN